MARGKKIEFTLESITVKFHCSKCDKSHRVKVDEFAFNHWSSPCELCGSHGELSVDVKCPGCGTSRSIEISGY